MTFGSGLRRNEIPNLTWKNIDFEEKLVTVTAKKESQNLLGWDPKGRKNRVVPLSDESAQLLAHLQLTAEETFPYIFISPERLERIRERQKIGTWNPGSQTINNLDRDFRILRENSGVDYCTLHDLRRTAITNWRRSSRFRESSNLPGIPALRQQGNITSLFVPRTWLLQTTF